jgi:tetratricopeptide (TPR) repeat protein
MKEEEEEMVKAYTKAIDLNNNSYAMYGISLWYEKNGQPKIASKFYERALAARNPLLLCKVARTNFKKNPNDASVPIIYNEVRHYNYNRMAFVQATRGLLDCHAQHRNWSKLLPLLEFVVKHKDFDSTDKQKAHEWLGYYYFNQKNAERAVFHYEQIMDNNFGALAILAQIYHANLDKRAYGLYRKIADSKVVEHQHLNNNIKLFKRYYQGLLAIFVFRFLPTHLQDKTREFVKERVLKLHDVTLDYVLRENILTIKYENCSICFHPKKLLSYKCKCKTVRDNVCPACIRTCTRCPFCRAEITTFL